jgi:hypothetical protein
LRRREHGRRRIQLAAGAGGRSGWSSGKRYRGSSATCRACGEGRNGDDSHCVHQRLGFWRLRPYSTGPRGRKRRRSAGWTTRHCGRYNEQGPDGLINISRRAAQARRGPIPAIHGVVRWRACDLIMRLHDEFGLSVSDDTIYRALRKAALTRLADAGCTPHQIMAVSGHDSLKEVERYTKAADQQRLAQEAMARTMKVVSITGKGRKGVL